MSNSRLTAASWARRSIRTAVVAGLVVALCGFGSCQRKPDLPDATPACPVATDVQVVERKVYAELPERVTQPVIDVMPAESQTWGQAKADADRRGLLLGVCNGQLREARWLEGQAVEGGQ